MSKNIFYFYMLKFFEDNRTVEDINKEYAGKNMFEIMKEEDFRQDIIQHEIDMKHEEICGNRSKMLTVKKLIEFLEKQDPNACILAYEPNSFAYIEQWPDLPNSDICTVKQDKAETQKHLENWYKGIPNAQEKIKKEIEKTYRYAKDNDIVIKFN